MPAEPRPHNGPGLCPVCRRRILLFPNNTLHWHTPDGRHRPWCTGSGKKPLAVVDRP